MHKALNLEYLKEISDFKRHEAITINITRSNLDFYGNKKLQKFTLKSFW